MGSTNGYDGIELRMSGKSVGLEEDAYRREICRLKDRYAGMELTFGCPVDFVVESESARKKEEKEVISFILSAAAGDIAYFKGIAENLWERAD